MVGNLRNRAPAAKQGSLEPSFQAFYRSFRPGVAQRYSPC